MDIEYSYKGNKFLETDVSVKEYSNEYFNDQIQLESDVFYELRKNNNIIPNKICDSEISELNNIKLFFEKNKHSFFFIYNQSEIIGSILVINNYIQCLAISRKYQRRHYGEQLVKYAVNYILTHGYSEVELKVLKGNVPAEKLYQKLGFKRKKLTTAST